MAVVEDVLGCSLAWHGGAVGFGDVPNWDSLGHVEIVGALEERLGIVLPLDEIPRLRTINSIVAFVEGTHARGPSVGARGVRFGLDGVVADATWITDIDAGRSELRYRGYDVTELAEKATFEDVAALLLYGDLPHAVQAESVRVALARGRCVGAEIATVVGRCESTVDAVRTSVSVLAARLRSVSDPRDAALVVTGAIPAVIAVHDALTEDAVPREPDSEAAHAADALTMMVRREPTDEEGRAFEAAMILHADHGSCASTFAARVTASTGVPVPIAVVAALSAFEGHRHAGAVRDLMMIDEAGDPDAFVAARRAAGLPVPGFGHRVYVREDPRCAPLRALAGQLALTPQHERVTAMYTGIEAAMSPLASHGLAVNVDLHTALLWRMLGFGADMAVPLFSVARVLGWCAHALEVTERPILIRPLLDYRGPGRRWVE
jgi:citrate synthase